MMSSKLVPELRFKEFSGEWEENSVSIKIISGNSYPLNSYVEKGILLIQGLNISSNKLNIEKPIYISDKFLTGNDIFIQKNDILLGLNRPIIDGKLKISLFDRDEQAILYQRAGILEFNKKKLSSLFLYYYLSSNIFLKQLLLELVGSDQPYIKSDLFKKTKNIFPKLKQEQQKIADTFSSLDNLIEAQTKKVELLKSHKKGLMQKLFPRDGAKVPEVRFKEFSGEWEEKPFELVFDRIPSKKYQITSKEYLKKGTYPVIDQGKHKIVGYSNEHIKVFKNDSVIVFGDHTRIFKYIDFSFIVGADGTQLIKTKQNFDNKFFYYQLLTKEIPNTGYNRHFKFIKDIIFKISPTPQEQQKIANTLSSLDNLIEAQTKKIELLKEHKKGLMQKMFVGDK